MYQHSWQRSLCTPRGPAYASASALSERTNDGNIRSERLKPHQAATHAREVGRLEILSEHPPPPPHPSTTYPRVGHMRNVKCHPRTLFKLENPSVTTVDIQKSPRRCASLLHTRLCCSWYGGWSTTPSALAIPLHPSTNLMVNCG